MHFHTTASFSKPKHCYTRLARSNWLPEVAAEAEAEQQSDQTHSQQRQGHVEGQGGDGQSQVHDGLRAVSGPTAATSNCCISHLDLLVSLKLQGHKDIYSPMT